jgi:hypothetical protein
MRSAVEARIAILTLTGFAAAVLCGRSAAGVEAAGAGSTKAAEVKDTALGRFAAGLKPGELKRFKTKGYTRDVLKSWYKWDHDEKGNRIYGAQKMFNVASSWSHDAKWDPVSRQVLFIGIGHYASLKFLTYSDATNTWTLMPVPPPFDPRQIACKVEEVLPGKRLKLSAGKAQGMWPEASLDILRDGKIVGEARVLEVAGNESVAAIRSGAGAIRAKDAARNRKASSVGYDRKKKKRIWTRGHTYDRLAISPEHRLFAVNWHGLHTYDIDARDWSRKPLAAGGGKDALQLAEYFPDMKAFVYTRSWGKETLAWDPRTKKARSLASKRFFGMHGVAEYNPIHKILLLGGGDGCRSVFSMDASGKVRKLKDSPVAFTCREISKFLCDPVSGEVLVQEDLRPKKRQKTRNRTFAFHPVKNEWREIPGLRLPMGLGVAIDTYGVLMFCTGGQVFVYKHKPLWPDEKTGK